MKARLIFVMLLLLAVLSFSAGMPLTKVNAATITHRICEFYYGSFTSTATQRILNTLPEMLVANTPGGSYDYHCPVATLQNAGIKVFSYVSTGLLREYKWDSTSPPNDHDTVMAEIRSVAAEGCYGVFLDEALNDANKEGSYSWAGHTMRDITNLAHNLGLKVMFGLGGYYFDNNLYEIADYILSDEWYGENGTYRSPQRGEVLHPERCIVIGYDGVTSATVAAARTNAALSKGFGYAYHTVGLSTMSSWFEDYMSRVNQTSSPTPLSVTTSSLLSGVVGSTYQQTLAARGGIAPYTWSISSGTLPTGLALTPATGMISGIPTTTGTSNLTIKVVDSAKTTTTRSFSVIIIQQNQPQSVSLPKLSAGTVSPASGTKNTQFKYAVTYTDFDNNQPPSWIKVDIDKGTLVDMTRKSGQDGDFTNGEIYEYTTSSLSIGTHSYHFSANDGTNDAIGDTDTHAGPKISTVRIGGGGGGGVAHQILRFL